MKKLLIVSIAILAFAFAVAAQGPATMTLKIGQERTDVGSRLKLKFLAVTDDSRCPEDVECVWAGNAVVRIQISGRTGRSKTYEFNTARGAKSNIHDRFLVTLVSLTPNRNSKHETKPENYAVRLTVAVIDR